MARGFIQMSVVPSFKGMYLQYLYSQTCLQKNQHQSQNACSRFAANWHLALKLSLMLDKAHVQGGC